MRLTGSRAYTRPQPIPKMPTGLVELMEDLTRDVLKHNPTDVYEFCAEHMRKLLDIRDGPSNKRPLTLEEKIARAQEKVKKRGDARWQKYVKQQKINHNASKVSSGPENILYIENTTKIPPVYPNLNIEKVSKIEISHEPGETTEVDSSIKPDDNVINNTEMEDCKQFEHKTETIANDHSVSGDDRKTTEIKTGENLYDLVPAKNVDETSVNALKEEFSNAPNIINVNDENKDKIDSTIMSTQETAANEKDIVKTTDLATEHQSNNSSSDMGKVVNAAIGVLNIINESSVTSSKKSDNVEDINDNKRSDFDEAKEKNVSTVLSTQENVSIDKEIVNKSEADMGKVVNTTMSVLNIINDSPLSPVQTLESEPINDNSNHVLEENHTVQTNINEVYQKNEDKPDSSSQEMMSSDQIVKTRDQKTEHQALNSLAEMGKFVNTAIGTLNIFNDSTRSQTQNAENIEGINHNISNSDLLQTQRIAQMNLSNEISMPQVNKITDVDNKGKLFECSESEDPVPENSLKVPDIQMNKDFDDNTGKQDDMTVISSAEDLKNGALMTIIDSDNIQLADDTRKSDRENDDIVQTIVEESKVDDTDNIENINIASGGGNGPELYNQTSVLKNVKVILGTKEPLVNAVIISETGKVQEELTEGKIEIRISQVAEALNNEIPHTIENINISEGSNSPVNSSLNGAKNEADLHIEKHDSDTHLDTKDTDSESNVISVNLEDIHNKNIKNVIKSTSIDESTDGMDNTSLIESVTSDTTDDMILNNINSSNMDLETAAVTIQKVFRSFMFKSRASTFDDNDENISMDEENDKKDETEFQTANINKERRGISRMDTVLQTVNEEKSLSLSTDDSSTISSAATTIQAHVRGFLVRNKLHSNKTASSTNSLVNSDGHDDGEIDHKNNKTVLNIHIVPEGGNYLSRDESILTSMDLSLDGSPPSSLNLHPLGYDKNERRKLKREDAIQSISPPSNNSGKLSEDSVKDVLITESDQSDQKGVKKDVDENNIVDNSQGSLDTSPTNTPTIDTVIEAHEMVDQESSDAGAASPVKNAKLDTNPTNTQTIETVTEAHEVVDQESSDAGTVTTVKNAKGTLTKQSSDEMDVVTPFEDKISQADSTSTSMLMHSGEFHDVVLPTKVSRGDTSVVSEFKNVLVYFLLWNNS